LLFLEIDQSNLTFCSSSTVFTSCSSITPRSDLASFATMKSSSETAYAHRPSPSCTFLRRLTVSSSTMPSGFVQNSNSVPSLRSTTNMRGLFGEHEIGSKPADLRTLNNELKCSLDLTATAKSKSTVVLSLP